MIRYTDTILLICCVLTTCLCEYTHNFIHSILRSYLCRQFVLQILNLFKNLSLFSGTL